MTAHRGTASVFVIASPWHGSRCHFLADELVRAPDTAEPSADPDRRAAARPLPRGPMLTARQFQPAPQPAPNPAGQRSSPAAATPAVASPPPASSHRLVFLCLIAGVAIGLCGQALIDLGSPAAEPGASQGFRFDLLLRDAIPRLLSSPLVLVAAASLCLAALLMFVPFRRLPLRAISVAALRPALAALGGALVATGLAWIDCRPEYLTAALVGSLPAAAFLAPAEPLVPLLAATAMLITRIGFSGWPPQPALVIALAGTAVLLTAGSALARVRRRREVNRLREVEAQVDILGAVSARTQEASEVATAVLAAANGFTAALSPSDIADQIVENSSEHLHAAGSVLLLWDETVDSFRVGAVGSRHTLNSAELRQVEVSPDSVPHFRPAGAGLVVAVDPGLVREPVLHSLLRRWKTASVIGVRLQRGERLLGLLLAARTRQDGLFSERDCQVLGGIAVHAAAALAHVNLIADLQSANQLKEEFMATMSHELRTPLNVIIGYTDLQLDGAFGDLVDDHLDTLRRVREQALQLLELIQATLDTSRLERGLVTVNLADTTVPKLIESLKAQIPPSWRKPTVQLNWRIPGGLPTLRTDPAKLQIILRNLVHNALKFTHHGLVTVAVLPHPNKERISFVVQDSGVGIKSEHLSEIFEMFRQAPNGEGSPGGVGLGLYIVKRLATILGAEIDVSSAPGRGATFRIHVLLAGPLASKR